MAKKFKGAVDISFFNWQTNGGAIDIQRISICFEIASIKWCAIDNVAVNYWDSYQIVTNEFNFVVLPDQISKAIILLNDLGFDIHFTGEYYLITGYSNLCIKLLTDEFYKEFPNKTVKINTCNLLLRVSCLKDTFGGIIYTYHNCFKSAPYSSIYDRLKLTSEQLFKLQNLSRLIEQHPKLKKRLPIELSFILNKLE